MSLRGWDFRTNYDSPQRIDPALQGRIALFRIIVIVVFGLLLYRIYWVQTELGEEFQRSAEDNQFARLRPDPPRGVIFDRHGQPLAVNLPSFNVTITGAFLPDEENERQALYERLSLLTGVPVTNTVAQQALVDAADPELQDIYSDLALLYNASITSTLDESGVIPRLPDSVAGIVETYSFAPYIPAVITSNVSSEIAYRVEQESVFLPGVRVIPQPIRHYPSGEYTSHIIGFMGPIPDETWLDRGYERDDRVGLFGLEVSQESILAGQKGERQIEVDWTGREVRQIGVEVPPIAGHNLHLTLDLDLQLKAYESAQYWLDRRELTPDSSTGIPPEAKSAAVVAMNPQTGEILAMVNIPTFDNNRFATEIPVDYYLRLARDDYEPLFNRAIGGQYPPGSVYKIITAAAALQEGVVSPARFLQAPGTIVIPNRYAPNDPGRAQEFVCWISLVGGEHGLVNMRRALAESCDIYFYKVTGGFDQDGEFVEGVGVDRLSAYSNAFGMGIYQNIELPLEAPGNIPTRQQKQLRYGEPWSTGDDYNMSIGQGFVTSTPMQVAQMAAVIANGGFLYQPQIVHHVTDENGEIVTPFEPRVLSAVPVDREYIEIIHDGLRAVTQEGGTAAGVNGWLDEYGITTAGKTGTSEFCDNIAIKRRWCFEGQRLLPTHAWYVGYAPYEDPEIVVAAFMYHGGEGSEWAAPIVRDVMMAYFQVGPYAPVEDSGDDTGLGITVGGP
ncbi:MAG TPA: penicillin-binding protein 2 [Anaerolineae bacterium]|nr:penicillin-binding protein 2 [Anaerolineae bacterium]